MSRFQGGNYASNTIIGWIVTILGLVMALYIGKMVAGENMRFLAMVVAGAVAVTVGLSLGRHYWVLIPIFSTLTGSMAILPVPFSYAEIGTIAAIGLYVVHVALKKSSIGFAMSKLDFLIFINLAWLLVVYLRNPVGVRAFGGDMIGGRDYVRMLIAVGGYVVLSQARVAPKLAFVFPLLIGGPEIISSLLTSASEHIPGLGRLIYPFYSDVSIKDFRSFASSASDETSRVLGLQGVGVVAITLLCCYYRPTSLLLPSNPFRFCLFVLSWIALLLSGFRSKVVYCAAMVLQSTLLRKCWSDLFALFFVGAAVLVILLGLQLSGIQTHYSVQRALSFIPIVPWDPAAVRAGEESTQWRIDMWKIAWEDKTIIKNKLMGDGFGFSAADFAAVMDVELGGGPGFIGGGATEAWLVRGSFHSGPLSTIRIAGFVGLFLILLTMVVMVFESLAIVQMTHDTPYFPWCLFIVMPIIYLPFSFIFVFGSFGQVLMGMILNVAYLRMIKTSVKEWKKQRSQPEPVPVEPLPA